MTLAIPNQQSIRNPQSAIRNGFPSFLLDPPDLRDLLDPHFFFAVIPSCTIVPITPITIQAMGTHVRPGGAVVGYRIHTSPTRDARSAPRSAMARPPSSIVHAPPNAVATTIT